MTTRKSDVRKAIVFLATALALAALVGAWTQLRATAACDGWVNKGGVCIAASLLQADFGDYQADQAPPSEALLSQLRTLRNAQEEVSSAWHVCEARLAQATAADRRRTADAETEAMFQRLNQAAPLGADGRPQVWDKTQGKYVAAPPVPPAAGRGGQ